MGKRVYTDLCIRGTVYPDAPTAARALGVTPDAVRHAARNGTLHRCGTRRVGAEPLPVRIAGQVFPTAAAAAAHFGVTPGAVYKAVSQGDPDRIASPARYNGAASKPVAIGPHRFASMSEASRALGFHAEFIAHALRRRSKRGMQRILAAAMACPAGQERKGEQDGQ